jgi:hypothetical protein
MHARAIDDAGERLRELRREEWQDLALAGVALGLALAATQGAQTLAVPLLVGGLSLGALGVRALWRHWDLVDRLAGEPAAYSIAEVREYAAREATMERRRRYAALVRSYADPSGRGRDARLTRAADDLLGLAEELEDESLELSPAAAVTCSRLLSDPTESPLLDSELPVAALRSTLCRIRAGFTARCADDA